MSLSTTLSANFEAHLLDPKCAQPDAVTIIPSEVMKHFPATLCVVIQCLLALALPGRAQVPQILNYQSRVAVEGVNFDSTAAGHDGLFKFALVNGDGTETYWSNDGTSVAGIEPAAALTLPVSKGLYSVLLGNTGMSPLDPAVFTHADVRLRVWFDDGTHGSQMLAPDQRIAAVAYALFAGTVPDGAVTGAKIAPGAISSAQLGSDAVQSGNIAPGAVGNPQMANPSITITTGTGLTGGGTVALGGTIALANSGVTSLAGGDGIILSDSTGAITIGSSATSANTPGALVLRDANGGFSVGTITGALLGNATTATSADNAILAGTAINFLGPLAGDVTGPQGAAVVGKIGGVAPAATNTPGAVVVRDAGGNFAAETISAVNFIGSGAGLTGVAGTLPWLTASGTAQQAAANTGYLADNAAVVTLTLPLSANAGDIVRVSGVGTGGWAVVPDAGQSIVGFAAGLGPIGSQGTSGAVQFVGNGAWQPMNESQLAPGAVQAGHIAAGAVTSTKLAADAVQAVNIATAAVENSKLANSTITINTGAGLAGGGALPLGGALTLHIPNGGIGSSLLAPGAALANLGTSATPTFANATLLHSGAGQNKPALTLDRGIVPKGRVTFQKSSEEPGWSGLVLSINADWDNATGYQYDDGGRSQSIMQLEYEWLAPDGYRQNEFNWTSSGRRIWAHYCRTDDSTKAGVNFGAAMSIVVPEIDTTGFPALQVESFKQEGSATQAIIQNNNTATPAAAAAINLRGVGSLAPLNGLSSDWQLGTDRWWTGTNNFYILDGKAGGTKERLFIDQTGKIGINNTAPSAQLDVTGAVNVSGTVNATNFTVNGGALPSLAKQSISRFAAELTNYYGTPDTVTSFLLTPSSQVADGAFVIKLLSLSPDQWRGRTVKLQMIVGVNGSSGGNLACSLAVAYRNTAMDGVTGSGYNVGDSEGSLNNTVMVVAAPTVADKLLLIESPEMTIPANITALSGGLGLQRTVANGDTNADVAYIVECRVIEQ